MFLLVSGRQIFPKNAIGKAGFFRFSIRKTGVSIQMESISDMIASCFTGTALTSSNGQVMQLRLL